MKVIPQLLVTNITIYCDVTCVKHTCTGVGVLLVSSQTYVTYSFTHLFLKGRILTFYIEFVLG